MDEVKKDDDGEGICPKCGSDDTYWGHQDESYSLPETYYKACNECQHQWDFT